MITSRFPEEFVELATSDENLMVRPVPSLEVNEGIKKLSTPLAAKEKPSGYMLDKMMFKLEDIWPNMQVFFSSGVKFELYHEWLLELLGPIDFRELYACTEFLGIGFQPSSDTGIWPNYDLLFFEFIPLMDYENDPYSAPRLLVNEVRPHTEYVIAITSIGGLYSYILGDVIQFVSVSPLTIEIIGRTNKEISLSGEKITEHQIISALTKSANETSAVISDFTATGRINRAPRHEIAIEFAIPPQNLDTFATLVDLKLCEENNAYSEIRQIGALDPVMVYETEPGTFLDFAKKRTEQGAPMGQAKIPHIVSNNDILDSLPIVRAATVY